VLGCVDTERSCLPVSRRPWGVRVLTAVLVLLVCAVVAVALTTRYAAGVYLSHRGLVAAGDAEAARGALSRLLSLQAFVPGGRIVTAVRRQAALDARLRGCGLYEQLREWAAEGQPEPRRQIAWYYLGSRTHYDERKRGLSPEQGRQLLEGLCREYESGYWVVEAHTDLALDAWRRGDASSAREHAQQAMLLGPEGQQSSVLRCIVRDAISIEATESRRDGAVTPSQ